MEAGDKDKARNYYAQAGERAAAAFPDAKVIHNERPEDDWWNSFNGTIGKFFSLFRELDLPEGIRPGRYHIYRKVD